MAFGQEPKGIRPVIALVETAVIHGDRAPDAADALKAYRSATGAAAVWSKDAPPGCGKCQAGAAHIRALDAQCQAASDVRAAQACAYSVLGVLQKALAGSQEPFVIHAAGGALIQPATHVGGVEAHTGGASPLDDDAIQALWELSDRTGIRPEYAATIMHLESRFSTTITNSIGCIGLNQVCPNAHHIPDEYGSWTAAQQIRGMITPMWAGIVNQFGPIQSAVRLEQANVLPASLATARGLDDVICDSSSPCFGFGPGVVWSQNPALDPERTGQITPRTIGQALAPHAASAATQAVIARAYELRSGETMRDPVFGDDFGGGAPMSGSWLSTLGTAAKYAGLAALGLAIGVGSVFVAPKIIG
jgi:hypothetical protein